MKTNIYCFMAFLYALEKANNEGSKEAADILKVLQKRKDISNDNHDKIYLEKSD